MHNAPNENVLKILQMEVRIGRTKPPWSEFFTRVKWELGIGRKEWSEEHIKKSKVQPIDWNLVKPKSALYEIHYPTPEEIAEEKRWDRENAHLGHTLLEKPYPLADLDRKNPMGRDILTFVRELEDGKQLWAVDDIGFLSGWAGYAIVEVIGQRGYVISEKCTSMA